MKAETVLVWLTSISTRKVMKMAVMTVNRAAVRMMAPAADPCTVFYVRFRTCDAEVMHMYSFMHLFADMTVAIWLKFQWYGGRARSSSSYYR